MALAATLYTNGNSTTNATNFSTATFATTAGDFMLLFVLHEIVTTPARLMARPQQIVGNAPWNSWPVGSIMLDAPGSVRKTLLDCWAIVPKTNAGTAQLRLDFLDTIDGIIWAAIKITGTGLAATPDFTAGDGRAPYHGLKCVRQVGLVAGEDSLLATPEGRLFSSRTPATSLVVAAFASKDNLNGAPSAGCTELSDQKMAAPALNMQVNAMTPGAAGYSYYATETIASSTNWAALLVEVPVIGSSGYTTLPERAIYA